MGKVLVDVFLMEAYVNEKMPNRNVDSVAAVKRSLYKNILAHHKVDSASFYSTFNYYQAHPQEFMLVLNLVDTAMSKIKPKDPTVINSPIVPPKNIENLPNFNEQEKVMGEVYLKMHRDSMRHKFGFKPNKGTK